MRVLHLGFEDPAMPFAGGGSVRTHEINRRLIARGYEITVLTTRFPGCVNRIQDGVRYVHVGPGRGRNRWTRLLGYVLGLPLAARRYQADLVVEDFFAPFSSMAVPWWSRRPTVGVVQWLHAKEKSRQYRLPLYLLERWGVRSHNWLVAVSEDTAQQLRDLNPSAHIEVIGNGVAREAFGYPEQPGDSVVFLGRLEFVNKGLDLLLTAWSAACQSIDAELVVAGDGPEADLVKREAKRLGVGDRIRFKGWVSGADKWALLAQARVVVVPSRHETFGMVALEALAASTPVIAFDIPGLREVVPLDAGWRLPPFDVQLLSEKIREVYSDPQLAVAAGRAGRRFAANFDWEALAARQDDVYRSALREGCKRTIPGGHS